MKHVNRVLVQLCKDDLQIVYSLNVEDDIFSGGEERDPDKQTCLFCLFDYAPPPHFCVLFKAI